jgi:hypothetical protein
MIRMPTLEQAREEARLLTARGLTVYVYRMGDGGYWLDTTPPRLGRPDKLAARYCRKARAMSGSPTAAGITQ